MTTEPTRISCLTPLGRSALAVLGLYGPEAWRIAGTLFRFHSGKRLPSDPVAGRFWLGLAGGEVGDEVVLVVKDVSPPHVELHCHGGASVIRYLIELAGRAGAVECPWSEFPSKILGDALEREATIALTRARTLRTASILLDQLHQCNEWNDLTMEVGESLACGDRVYASEIVEPYSKFTGLGRHLVEPWRLVLCGAPNVGKSSLCNALAGYRRSITSETPGTTRDVVSTVFSLDGWPVEVADTAGLHDSNDDLEGQGIDRARQTLESVALRLWILDASKEPEFAEPGLDVHYVVNKTDLEPAWDLASVDGLHVSALTGEGIDQLVSSISSWLVPEVPEPGSMVPFTGWLCDFIDEHSSTRE